MADLGLGEFLVGLNPKDADQAFVKTKPLFIAKKRPQQHIFLALGESRRTMNISASRSP
jgi:hypothetical protein